jgi:HPt (histidine-containing phosphotransfer) domain-containing protein
MIDRVSFKERFGYFDKEIVVEIIDIFIDEYDDRIIKITRVIKDQNLDELKKTVHAFKGVIANFEVECIAYQKAASMEQEATELMNEIKEGQSFSKEDSDKFFTRISKDFELFKTDSLDLLNELKDIRGEYL